MNKPSEPLDLRAVEARLGQLRIAPIVAPTYRKDARMLLAALRETRAIAADLAYYARMVQSSGPTMTKYWAVLASCADGGPPSEGP